MYPKCLGNLGSQKNWPGSRSGKFLTHAQLIYFDFLENFGLISFISDPSIGQCLSPSSLPLPGWHLPLSAPPPPFFLIYSLLALWGFYSGSGLLKFVPSLLQTCPCHYIFLIFFHAVIVRFFPTILRSSYLTRVFLHSIIPHRHLFTKPFLLFKVLELFQASRPKKTQTSRWCQISIFWSPSYLPESHALQFCNDSLGGPLIRLLLSTLVPSPSVTTLF